MSSSRGANTSIAGLGSRNQLIPSTPFSQFTSSTPPLNQSFNRTQPSAPAAAASAAAAANAQEPIAIAIDRDEDDDALPHQQALQHAPQVQAQVPIPSDQEDQVLEEHWKTHFIQQLLTSAVKEFTEANAASSKTQQALDRFKSIGVKEGRLKQLPKSLRLEMKSRARFTDVPGDDSFYANELDDIRRLERETSDKYYDILVKAKEKHIEHLGKKCNMKDFLPAVLKEFRLKGEEYASDWNKRNRVKDLRNPSDATFAFPVEKMFARFEKELMARLTAITRNQLHGKEEEKQQQADQLIQQHKAQESVLTGAHTGETIANVARKISLQHIGPVARETADLKRKIDDLTNLTKLLMQQQQQAGRIKHPPRSNQVSHSKADSRRDDRHSDRRARDRSVSPPRANSKHSVADDDRSVSDSPPSAKQPIVVDSEKKRSQKRKSEAEDEESDKRRKVTVTLPPKNGAGGDRNSKSAQQPPPRSSGPPVVKFRQNIAKPQGRGPRSDETQVGRQ